MNAEALHREAEDHGGDTRDWPIFVISLSDATARREAISGQLSAMSLDFEILDAVDGRRGLPAEYENMIDRAGTLATLGRAMTGGEYACALSHLAIYRRILDDDLPGAVVLEDDAILGPAFSAFLEQRAYNLADLIQMDHFQARVWRFGGRHRIDPGVTLARWSQNSYLTTGYSISRKGAEHILAKITLAPPDSLPQDKRNRSSGSGFQLTSDQIRRIASLYAPDYEAFGY